RKPPETGPAADRVPLLESLGSLHVQCTPRVAARILTVGEINDPRRHAVKPTGPWRQYGVWPPAEDRMPGCEADKTEVQRAAIQFLYDFWWQVGANSGSRHRNRSFVGIIRVSEANPYGDEAAFDARRNFNRDLIQSRATS